MSLVHRALAIHGFLGSPVDWQLVRQAVGRKSVECDWLVPHLFSPGNFSAHLSWDAWTLRVLEALDARFGVQEVDLLGYSLGGRLAIHLALRDPSRFRRIWLYSTNPGVLFGPVQDRRTWERAWAEKMRHGDWHKILAEWNAQVVFARSKSREIDEPNEDVRDLLALSFTNWSLADHSFQLEQLKKLDRPLFWWFGEHDKKFLRVKTELERQNMPGEMKVLPKAGHRLLLDAPEKVAEALI